MIAWNKKTNYQIIIRLIQTPSLAQVARKKLEPIGLFISILVTLHALPTAR